MSIDATRWAWGTSLKPTCKLILLSLADRAGENHQCWPSLVRLHKDTGLDRKTVIKGIGELESAGILSVKRDVGKGNYYQLIGVEGREANEEAGTSTKNNTSSKNGTSTKSGTRQYQKRNGNQYQKRNIEPINRTINNLPSINTEKSIPKIKKKQPVKTTIRDDFNVSAGVMAWYCEKNYTEDIAKHLENFKDQCQAKGYVYANFDAAFKNAIRNDWASLRKNTNHNGVNNGKHGISEEQWLSTDF